MKKILYIYLFFISTLLLEAQSLTVFDGKASSFPIVKAKAYAFDNVGKRVTPKESEIRLLENGVQKNVTSINCPPNNAPQAVLVSSIIGKDIDFKRCVVKTNKDSVVEKVITNDSDVLIEIKEILIAGRDANVFLISSMSNPNTLAAGESKSMNFRFSPRRIGLYEALLIVITKTDTFTLKLVGEGVPSVIDVVTLAIDFGKVRVGAYMDTTLVILKNRGVTPVVFTPFKFLNHTNIDFTFVGKTTYFELLPNEEKSITLRFKPIFIGKVYNILFSEHNADGSGVIIEVFGEGAADTFIPDTVRTTIALSNSIAKAGESSTLYLFIKEKQKLDIPNAPKQFVADIVLNNTVMFINDVAFPCITNDKSTCRIGVEGTYSNSDTLARIPFTTTLGNTDNAIVELTNFFWKDTVVRTEVRKENGSIRIKGVCEEGGVRLYVPNGNTMSLASRPNPVHEKVRIEYGLAETTSVVLEIIDINGQVIATPIASNVSAGAYAIDYDASNLGNGIYILRLRTQNEVLTARMEVVH